MSHKSAHFSPCGDYRYWLRRQWNKNRGTVCWVMLNPSTADAENDDPTIIRCIMYTDRWGYGGFSVVNLHALRSTDPSQLLKAEHPTDSLRAPGLNLQHIRREMRNADLVVCAWGVQEKYIMGKDQEVFDNSRKPLFCLETGKNGQPKHPLYLDSVLTPQLFRPLELVPVKAPKLSDL